jgi:hypothetical protein
MGKERARGDGALRAKAAICLFVALCVLAAAAGCAGGGPTGKALGQTAQQEGAGNVARAAGGEQGLPGNAAGGDAAGAAGSPESATSPEGGETAPDATGAGADAGASLSAAGVTHQLVDVDNSGDVIEIKEKMFIAQTNDIYLNIDDYIGKSVRYEGYFAQYQDAETYETFNFVVRNGPGCCPGVDNTAGFEVAWDGQWPNPNDWVEVFGTLELYEDGGEQYIRVGLSSLSVMDERGAEYVTQ